MPALTEPESPDEYYRRRAEARKLVRSSARSSFVHLRKDEPAAIWSSPTGRTLDTAKIILYELYRQEVKPAALPRITPLDNLTEVRNFEWNLFLPLALGGEVECDGIRFAIDPRKSNPQGLGFGEYFFQNILHMIPRAIKDEWPESYVKRIESFEPAMLVRKRMLGVLKTCLEDKEISQFILVTHDALTGFLAHIFTDDKENELPKGGFAVLESEGDELFIKVIGANTSGNSRANVFEHALQN